MAAGMRPGALGPLGAAAATAAAAGGGKGAADGGKDGSKAEPKKEPAAEGRDGRERERYGGRRDDPEQYDSWAERERYERERERYEGRGGPRGPPGPFGRDGPPPSFMHRDGPRGPPDFRWGRWLGWVGNVSLLRLV